MSSQKPNNAVPKLYHGVINEVIDSVRDSFLDEGIDEAILSDLKAMWKRRLEESKALEDRKTQSQEQVNTTNIHFHLFWPFLTILTFSDHF